MTDNPLREAIARIELLATSHEDAARRYAGYHATAVSRCEESCWDERSRENAELASDLRALVKYPAGRSLMEQKG